MNSWNGLTPTKFVSKINLFNTFLRHDAKDNDPFDVDHLYRDLRVFLKRANIDKTFRFHDLRHSFASHFMMNGGNIYDLQKILGQTSLEMTQRYLYIALEKFS